MRQSSSLHLTTYNGLYPQSEVEPVSWDRPLHSIDAETYNSNKYDYNILSGAFLI